ncbi:MAG: CARDB domain-containing protein [Candidatus Bathyarchaeia archaeon]
MIVSSAPSINVDVITNERKCDNNFNLICNAYPTRWSLYFEDSENWIRTYGGAYCDWADDVEKTPDGGYIIAGSTGPLGGLYNFWVVKTDINGRQLWNRTYGGSGDEWAFGIAVSDVTSPIDGGYIVAGVTNSSGAGDYDAWIVKIDENGNEQWNKTYGTSLFNAVYDIESLPQGGYILAGSTKNPFPWASDFWLLRIDANGNLLWNKTFSRPDIDVAYDVEITPDGGFVLVGVAYDGATIQWMRIIKTDSEGNMVWEKLFGLMEYFPMMLKGFGVTISSDGGYVAVGSAPLPRNTFCVVKYDPYGNQEWNKTYVGIALCALDIETTVDGGYILCGVVSEDFGIIKIDSCGAIQWSVTYDLNATAVDVELAPNGGYIVAGYTIENEEESNFCLVRFKVHDIAITDLKTSKRKVVQGDIVTVNVTIQNQGDYDENVSVAIYANATIIGVKVATLVSGNSTTLTYIWNTTNFAIGKYKISAEVAQVTEEVDVTDNKYIDGLVKITPPITIKGPYYTLDVIEYYIVVIIEGRRPCRVISKY